MGVYLRGTAPRSVAQCPERVRRSLALGPDVLNITGNDGATGMLNGQQRDLGGQEGAVGFLVHPGKAL